MGKPVARGQRLSISAQEFNGLQQGTAQALRESTRRPPSPKLGHDSNFIKVRNESGVDLPRFGIVGLHRSSNVGPVITPTANLAQFLDNCCLKAKKPNGTGYYKNDRGRFGVLWQPLEENAIGWAQISGVAVVKIDMIHEEHAYADVATNDTEKLKSGECGAAEILWQEGAVGGDEGKGTKWAVVRLGNFEAPPLFARIDEIGEIGYECEIVNLNSATGQHPTGRMVTADHRLFYPNVVAVDDIVRLDYDRCNDKFFIVHVVNQEYNPGYAPE